MLFKKKVKRYLGVDIGSSSVRVVWLDKSGSSYVLQGYGVEELPLGVVSDRNIHDIEAVGKSLERAIASAKSKLTSAAVAVGGSAVVTRIIEMPNGMSDFEIESQIQLDADQYIPYPLDEVAIDFARIGVSPSDPEKEEILLASCRKESIETREAVLSFAGLTPAIVDLEVYAMERASDLTSMISSGGSQSPIALVDIGSSILSFNIIHDGHVIYTREQMFGGRQLTEEIQRHYGMPYLEAERAKKRGELPEDYESAVLNEYIEQMVEQIDRSLQFFLATGQFSKVDGIILVGGGARIQQLPESIENKLGCKTELANPFVNMQVGSKVNPTLLIKDAPSLMVACGLALRSFD